MSKRESENQKRKGRRARDKQKRADSNFADGIDRRLLRSPHHLMSGERAFIGRTWKAADAARTNMSDEKKAALDEYRAAFPTI